MNARFDPYEALDVDRDVPPAEIRKAYRRAAKKAHPDAGGSPEKWETVARALVVLSDPAKRERFDRTGECGEANEPDNSVADAISFIESFIGQLVEKYLHSQKAEDDPRHRFIFDEIKIACVEDIQACRAEIKIGEGVKLFVEDFGARFSAKGKHKDVLARMMERRFRQVDATIEQLRDTIKLRELVIEIVKDWKFDPSPFRDVVSPRKGKSPSD